MRRRRYSAFISYRHADNTQEGRLRDEDELPANADLATGIRAALEVSDHLIVLCSPRSTVSPWVRKEVREFKELGRSDRILAIIIAGEPNADESVRTCKRNRRDV
ncbi:MAG: toll/interleukin-1 receptor domain-containing protein [Verrucomicrobia bacterium]|nr:toll/interleukin-1 receptor domain-containing protein [Verrucomicrobiota bacterium]